MEERSIERESGASVSVEVAVPLLAHTLTHTHTHWSFPLLAVIFPTITSPDKLIAYYVGVQTDQR
jgi:hypothetical protein